MTGIEKQLILKLLDVWPYVQSYALDFSDIVTFENSDQRRCADMLLKQCDIVDEYITIIKKGLKDDAKKEKLARKTTKSS